MKSEHQGGYRGHKLDFEHYAEGGSMSQKVMKWDGVTLIKELKSDIIYERAMKERPL